MGFQEDEGRGRKTGGCRSPGYRLAAEPDSREDGMRKLIIAAISARSPWP
jgi:hypothetical protein